MWIRSNSVFLASAALLEQLPYTTWAVFRVFFCHPSLSQPFPGRAFASLSVPPSPPQVFLSSSTVCFWTTAYPQRICPRAGSLPTFLLLPSS